jgi:hypothetical protein
VVNEYTIFVTEDQLFRKKQSNLSWDEIIESGLKVLEDKLVSEKSRDIQDSYRRERQLFVQRMKG